jgi:hypothetical protein
LGAYLGQPVRVSTHFRSRHRVLVTRKILQNLQFYSRWYKLLGYDTNKVILDLEGGRPQVRQVNGVLGEEGFGLVVADGGVDDDIVALLPVDGGGDAVPVTGLES